MKQDSYVTIDSTKRYVTIEQQPTGQRVTIWRDNQYATYTPTLATIARFNRLINRKSIKVNVNTWPYVTVYFSA